MSKSTEINSQSHFKRLGRELAMQYLFQTDLNGEDNKLLLSEFWQQADESGKFPQNRIFRKGREYAEELIAGIIEHKDEIDKVILEKSEKWNLDRMPIVDRNIMRVAIYEMFYVAEVPPVVSINEAVGISKDYSTEKSGPFINGLLNSVKDDLDRPAREAVDKL